MVSSLMFQIAKVVGNPSWFVDQISGFWFVSQFIVLKIVQPIL